MSDIPHNPEAIDPFECSCIDCVVKQIKLATPVDNSDRFGDIY